MTLGLSLDSASMSRAIFERGQGHRPSWLRLFSSMVARITAGDAGCGPRDTRRMSYVFSSMRSSTGTLTQNSSSTSSIVPKVRCAGPTAASRFTAEAIRFFIISGR